MKTDVTIGIPVYNSADYIERTMLSALSQSFSDIEFLIVDDCGTDGSIDIVNKLQQLHPRGNAIRILHNESNCGVGFSRNRITDEAHGRLLYFLDSDDLIEPDTIQKLYDAIINNNAQIAYGSYEIVDGINNDKTQVYQKPQMVFCREGELARYAFENIQLFHVSACNQLIDISFLRSSGVRFPDVSYWEDMAFTTELVTKVTSAVLLPDITYHYIAHNNSLSHYQERDKINKLELLENISVLNRLKEMCKSLDGKTFLPYLCLNLEINSFYVICHIIKKEKNINPKFSAKELREALWHPMSIKQLIRFRHKRVANFLFFFLSVAPVPLFTVFIKLLGKLKRCI